MDSDLLDVVGLTVQAGGASALLDVERPDFPWAYCAGSDVTAHPALHELRVSDEDDGAAASAAEGCSSSPTGRSSSAYSSYLAQAERRGVLIAKGAPSFALGLITAPSLLMSWDKLMSAGTSVLRGSLPTPLRPPPLPRFSKRCDSTGQHVFQASPSGAGKLMNGPIPWIGPGISATHEPHARAALPSVPDVIHPSAPARGGPPRGRLERTRVVMWDISCGREAFPIPVVVDCGLDVPPAFLRRLLLASVHYTPSYIGKENVQPDAAPSAPPSELPGPISCAAALISAPVLVQDPEHLLASPGRKRFAEWPLPASSEGGDEPNPVPATEATILADDDEEKEETVAPLIDMSHWHTLEALSAALSPLAAAPKSAAAAAAPQAAAPGSAAPNAAMQAKDNVKAEQATAASAPCTPSQLCDPPVPGYAAGDSSSSNTPTSTASEKPPQRNPQSYVKEYLACTQVYTHFLMDSGNLLECPLRLPCMPAVQEEFHTHEWHRHSTWACSCGAQVQTAVLTIGGDFSVFRCMVEAEQGIPASSAMDSVSFMLCPHCARTPAWQCKYCSVDDFSGGSLYVPHNLTCCLACSSPQPHGMPWAQPPSPSSSDPPPVSVRYIRTVDWCPQDPSPFALPPGADTVSQLNQQLKIFRAAHDPPQQPSAAPPPVLPQVPPSHVSGDVSYDELLQETALLQDSLMRFTTPQLVSNATNFSLPVSDIARVEKRSPNGYVYELHQDCVVGVDTRDMLALLEGSIGAQDGMEDAAGPALRESSQRQHTLRQLQLMRSMSERMDLRRLPMLPLPLGRCTPKPYFVEDWLVQGGPNEEDQEAASGNARDVQCASATGSHAASSCPSQGEMLGMLERYTPALRWAGILSSNGAASLPRYAADGSMQWVIPSQVATAMVDAVRSGAGGGRAGQYYMFGGWVDNLPASSPSPPVPSLKQIQRIRDGYIAAALAWGGNATVHQGSGLERGCRFPLAVPSKRPSAAPPQTLHLPFVSDGLQLLTAPVVECPADCPCHGKGGTAPPTEHRNDVVQRGIRLPLEVYWTGFGAKGWGVRCRCAIPKGTFVAVYAGLVTPNPSACVAYVVDLDTPQLYHESSSVDRPPYKSSMEEGWSSNRELQGCELLQRNMVQNASDEHCKLEDPSELPAPPLESEPAELPVQQAASSGNSDTARAEMMRGYYDHNKLCVDASVYCNISRFFNHSCKPNMSAVPVYFSPTADVRQPALALFASEQIPAYTELTWHYVHGYGQGDESVQYKDADGKDVQRCLCDEVMCRDKTRLQKFWTRTARGRLDYMHLSPQEVDERLAAERWGLADRPELPCSTAPVGGGAGSSSVKRGRARSQGASRASGGRGGGKAPRIGESSPPSASDSPPSTPTSSSDDDVFALMLPDSFPAAPATSSRSGGTKQRAGRAAAARSGVAPQGGSGEQWAGEEVSMELAALIDLTSSDEEHSVRFEGV